MNTKCFLQILLLEYNIANISKILNSFKNQLMSDYVIIAVDNNKRDLSYDFCKMFARQNNVRMICISGFNTFSEKIRACMSQNVSSYYCYIIQKNDRTMCLNDTLYFAKLLRFANSEQFNAAEYVNGKFMHINECAQSNIFIRSTKKNIDDIISINENHTNFSSICANIQNSDAKEIQKVTIKDEILKQSNDLTNTPCASLNNELIAQQMTSKNLMSLPPKMTSISTNQNNNEKSIVCYTCVTGGYDSLLHVTSNKYIDFICFSDDMNIIANGWQIYPMPAELKTLSPVKQQRIIKICPHRYLAQYKTSIWVDANFIINCNRLNEFINYFNFNNIHFYTKKHPTRNCVYQEGYVIKNTNRLAYLSKAVDVQLNKYKNEYHYPENNGLFETGLIVRQHNEKDCIDLDEKWANELLNHTHRDQLSLNVSQWLVKVPVGIIPDRFWRPINNGFFRLTRHASYNKQQSELTIGIVNYNTTKLTNCLIKSIRKQFSGHSYIIKVFDNSDTEKFVSCDENVIILDNTKQQLINYDNEISKCTAYSNNNYANLKHSMAIDFLIKSCQTRGLVLFDSDTLLIKNIDFIDYNYVTAAQLAKKQKITSNYVRHERLFPFIQFFNVKMFKDLQLNYYDFNRILYSGAKYSKYYDTGASFYEDLKNKKIPFKPIKYSDYIVHNLAGSWARSNEIEDFLRKYEKYYI